MPSEEDFEPMCLLLVKLFSPFLRLSNGDAVALTFTIDKCSVVVGVDVVVVVLLLFTSVFGLSLLRFSINIPELD